MQHPKRYLVCVQLVKMKGRVACEISTCECLIAAEAIFKGVFTGLEPASAVAVLSALVNQHKLPLDEDPRPGLMDLGNVPEALKDAVRALEELTMELGALLWDMKASQITASAYLGVSVRPSLSAVRPLFYSDHPLKKGVSGSSVCHKR
jgi:superfamily II RNA helicase